MKTSYFSMLPKIGKNNFIYRGTVVRSKDIAFYPIEIGQKLAENWASNTTHSKMIFVRLWLI